MKIINTDILNKIKINSVDVTDECIRAVFIHIYQEQKGYECSFDDKKYLLTIKELDND